MYVIINKFPIITLITHYNVKSSSTILSDYNHIVLLTLDLDLLPDLDLAVPESDPEPDLDLDLLADLELDLDSSLNILIY